MRKLLWLFCILTCFVFSTSLKSRPKIAIIGGGIGGTSCAYFLRKLFQNKAEISLIERDAIGGRLSLMNVDGDFYEAGGAVIHPSNRYMREFAKLLGLHSRELQPSKFGIYDGQKFAFREYDWYLFTVARFFWRYGFSIIYLKKQVAATLNDFTRIYNAQDNGISFTTVSNMMDYMNPEFRNMTQQSLQSFLAAQKYSQLFINELVQSVMMVNYGQTNNITAFAGFVSLAGAENDLWSVSGGNKKVPEGLLRLSLATVASTNVLEISLNPNSTYTLFCNASTPKDPGYAENYDIVILAAPLIEYSTNIKFTNFGRKISIYERPFHRTITTMVKGDLNPSAFNTDSVPNEIFTFKNNLLFNSIGKISPVFDRKDRHVYKIFSRQPLTEGTINHFFNNVEVVKEKDWFAYPQYNPPENLPPFVLHHGLYYINAIESLASAMEMSAIASRNVALLAYNNWNKFYHLIDDSKRPYKDEL